MSITVRDAIAADIEAVLGLMRELAEHEGLSQYFQLTHETLTRYCFTTPARLHVLVAVQEEGIVGYATYMPQLSPWAGSDGVRVEQKIPGGVALRDACFHAVDPVVQYRDRRARAEVERGPAAEIPVCLTME